MAEIRGGYVFWGVVVGGILLVELLGAMAHWLNKHLDYTIPWTTISGMVGHLEQLWPTTAVFVVALIAPVAFYTLVPSKQLGKIQWRGPDLNRRHHGFQPCALPTELPRLEERSV